MFQIISHKIHKTSALPANIKIDLSPKERQIFSFIQSAVQQIPGNLTVRVAGGWVRDRLLNRPSKDIDLTVEGMKGVDFADYLKNFAIQNYGANQKVIGTIKDTEARPEQIKNLAVAFLKIFGEEIEILNLRGKEVYEEGSRNPVSTDFNATPEEDAHRRDLTINALFYNINTGRIEDFTGKGYDDLATMTLRTPLEPKATFTDDPLRLLRVLRFNSRYPNSRIAPEVLQAMSDPEVHHQIVRKILNPDDPMGIVTERTAEEFRKIMKGEQPEVALEIMYKTGLLQKMLNLPESFNPLDMDQRNLHHQQTVINHTLSVLKNMNDISKEFKLDDNQRMMMNISALFHDLGKLDPRSQLMKSDGTIGYFGDPSRPDSITHQQSSADVFSAFSKSLGLTNKEQEFIGELISSHMNPHAHVEAGDSPPTDKQLRKYIRKNPSWVFQYMHAMADSMSKTDTADPTATQPYRDNLQRLRDLAPTADSFGNLPPTQDLLNGREIMSLVGLPPAPPPGLTGYINIIKERIAESIDENPNLTKEEAVQIVREMISNGELDAYRV